eukprot:TRINITY_DN3129_c0_g1_i2.p1 TRINITY_DN3129_c0_g1~~TRINITY_DN3129_c0_g1_i2.p1  ORF type:complete len:219 (-),score=37.68 TRINITY_DN3129_c0_g1_i2:247-903(-)
MNSRIIIVGPPMSHNSETQRNFIHESARVKSVDLHPTWPWVLSSLLTGQLFINDYNTQQLIQAIQLTTVPVRTAKFITRNHWLVAGADDKMIRVYNYETLKVIKCFEGHSDFIRSLTVHPILPYVLSASDDKLIKLWNWEEDWVNVQVFEGHNHYVMQVLFSPKDTNTFASASLDGTIKIWNLDSNWPQSTLEGHEEGVNCLEYFGDWRWSQIGVWRG